LFAVLAGHFSSGSLFNGRKKRKKLKLVMLVCVFRISAHSLAYFCASLRQALSMTRRAARQHFPASDVILLFKLRTIVSGQVAVLPLHIEDLRFRPDLFLRVSVT
jgi:hypothetical protein